MSLQHDKSSSLIVEVQIPEYTDDDRLRGLSMDMLQGYDKSPILWHPRGLVRANDIQCMHIVRYTLTWWVLVSDQ